MGRNLWKEWEDEDVDVVWNEWVGQRGGLRGVGGTERQHSRSGWDGKATWKEWVGERWLGRNGWDWLGRSGWDGEAV